MNMDDSWVPIQKLQSPQLQQNLFCLQSRRHELLHVLQRPSEGEPLLIQKQDSWIRCIIASEPPQWIMGKTDPKREAEQLIQRVRNIGAEKGLLVMMGGTGGWGVAAVLPRLLQNPELHVLVVEPSRERILSCLLFCDLRAALISERLHFLLCDLDEKRILEKMEPLNLWDLDPLTIYIGPELERCIDPHRFHQLFRDCAGKYQTRLNQFLDSFAKRQALENTIRRVLFINCWSDAPGDVHIQCIHRSLQERKIECRSLSMNRYRFDTAGLEYRRQAERQVLQVLYSFQPDMVISFGYHAPQFVSPRVFEAVNTTWVQMVSNIAYYDEYQYPGEYTFLLDRHLIPIFRRRGYQNLHFIPIMADYTVDRPVQTNGRFPVVFVGNSLGLPPGAVQQFYQHWSGRNDLIRYLQEAESQLGDFDRQSNLYVYLNENPIPQVLTLKEEYEVFRFLLCQCSANRRKTILEKLIPYGLILYGGDWDSYLPSNSPLRQCLQGVLPLHEEPKIFSHGTVFVNIHSVGHVTGPNMRFFNVPGMGAFQISDQQQFSCYLESEKEAVYSQSVDNFVEKVRYYLDHPGERDQIRNTAQKRVIRDWTYRNWVDQVLKIVIEKNEM